MIFKNNMHPGGDYMFNNTFLKITVITLLILTLSTFSLFTPAIKASDLLGQLLKTFGIGFIVDKFSADINNFINTLTLNKGIEVENSTKVVPIVTIGSGTYAGAVQISGPVEAVKKVKAVAQLEGDFQDGAFRIRALVPINSKNPTDINNIKRIKEVGITALIDINV